MKNAFTLLELIFVIIVIGIISTYALPKMGGGKLQKAADQVVSHIRYTQHLAMVDDKFDRTDAIWFRKNWQIQFESGVAQRGYAVYSDLNGEGNASNDELAKDPLTQKTISHGSGVADLGSKYGITNIDFSASCDDGATGELSFDFLGRPYTHITNSTPTAANIHEHLLTSDCNITLTNSEGDMIISVEAETGYTRIINN